MASIEKAVGNFRPAIQDLLVPELKAIQTELRHHHQQFLKIEERIEALHRQMDERFKSMYERMDQRFENLHKQMDERFESIDKRFTAVIDSIHSLEKILERLDLKEKVTELETRFSKFDGRVEVIEKLVMQRSPRNKQAV